VVANEYIPDCGDIVWMSFTPQAGHEQAGHRPALVVSPREYNAVTSLALCCPITSQVKGYPFEVALPSTDPLTGVVLADQVKSLDWRARGACFGSKCSSGVINEVIGKIGTLLA
jgi:mRNA interferase MazF